MASKSWPLADGQQERGDLVLQPQETEFCQQPRELGRVLQAPEEHGAAKFVKICYIAIDIEYTPPGIWRKAD